MASSSSDDPAGTSTSSSASSLYEEIDGQGGRRMGIGGRVVESMPQQINMTQWSNIHWHQWYYCDIDMIQKVTSKLEKSHIQIDEIIYIYIYTLYVEQSNIICIPIIVP